MKNTMRRLAAAVASTMIATTVLTVAAPAQAALGDVTLTFPQTVVLNKDTCVDFEFNYAVELPADVRNWSLDVNMYGPDGVEEGGQLVGTFASSPFAGTADLQLCSLFQPVGTYRLTTTLDYTLNGPGFGNSVYGTPVEKGTFKVVRSAKSRTTLSAKRQGGKIVATAKVAMSTGDAWSPVPADGKVIFQKRAGKKWKKVGASKTDTSGKATVQFRSKGRTQVRAVFKGAGELLVGTGNLPVPGSTSKVRTVR